MTKAKMTNGELEQINEATQTAFKALLGLTPEQRAAALMSCSIMLGFALTITDK